VNVRRWIVRRLGGEWYEDDWYDYDGDEDSWSFSFRLHDLFRRRNANLTNITNERVVDMDSAITLLDPDVSQFETLLMKVAHAGAEAAKVEWLEDELFPRLQPDPDVWFDGVWVE
jgi:hypothetical protein